MICQVEEAGVGAGGGEGGGGLGEGFGIWGRGEEGGDVDCGEGGVHR